MFELIKKCYISGLYNKDDLDLFLLVNFITKEEYNKILEE